MCAVWHTIKWEVKIGQTTVWTTLNNKTNNTELVVSPKPISERNMDDVLTYG